jgi:putative ABC transport system ATP-binding protein
VQAAAYCENVTRIFKTGSVEVRALDGVTFEMNPGEMVAIAGPSGSGKSTLLNMLGCLDRPTSGRVFIGGEDTSVLSRTKQAIVRNHKVGFIFQSFHLIPVLTAYENVEFALQIQGKLSPAQRKERIMPVLEALDIAQLADRKPGEMSGGQQQRVAIARALVKKPVLILADEPTANLDSKTSKAIIEQMVKLNREEGTTFLLSTHDPMVMEFAPRLVKLRDGKIVEDIRKGGA